MSTPLTTPSTPIEKILAEIWRAVLNLDEVGVTQTFLDVGGNSITAAQLAAEISARIGVRITLLDLFNAATIREQAAIIQKALLAGGKNRPSTGDARPPILPNPAAQFDPFPLTDIQQAYWVGRTGSLDLGGVSTHTYFEVETGPVDLPRLAAALNQLIQRHPALRTRILPDGTQQVLREAPPYEIRAHHAANGEAAAALCAQLRAAMSHQVLPTDQPPFFDIRAVYLPAGRMRFHFSFDALALDGWSRRLFFREWEQRYHDPALPLSPLDVTYRDYVLTERSYHQSARYQQAQAYWWARLADFPAAPELPLAAAPETIRKPEFTRRTHRLTPEGWARLKAFAAAHNLTNTAVLAGVYADVLRFWSRSPRFALNLTVFNRNFPHPQINQVIGDFTSLMLLAAEPVQHADSFAARTAQLQRQMLRDFEHTDLSGVEVLRELIRRKGLGGQPMPVVFTRYFDPDAGEDMQAPEAWLGETTFSTSQTPQVWLDLIVANERGSIALHLNSVDALFPPSMVADLFDALVRWLEWLAHDETAWQTDWPATARFLLPPEHAALQAAANDTAAALPGGMLHELFAAQAARTPDAPAIIAARRTLSYAELFAHVRQIGETLRERGARPNQHVAIVMEKGWEQVAAALGIHFSGAAYLPIDAATPVERLHHLLEYGEVKLALTQPHLLEGISWPPQVEPIPLDELTLSGGGGASKVKLTLSGGRSLPEVEGPPLEWSQRPEDLAYTIFTSGSTGIPKGVMIDHRGAVNTIQDLNARFGINARDRVLALSALTFDLSVYDIFGTLAAGGALVMPEPAAARDPSRWAELVRAHGVTLWNSVPALMSLLVEYMAGRGETLDTLRLAWLSGDWIPVTLPAKIRALCPQAQVISMGGATEASIWSILYPVGDVPPGWTSIPYGKAMRNQQVYVLNDALEACPVGLPGDLYIGGAGLALGYWRDPEKTAASFITHPRTGARLYRTGDLGRWLLDGNIEFLGREDFQVKVQGFRVELGEIEHALRANPAVRAAVVTVHGERFDEKSLAAYLVPAEGAVPDPEGLRAELAGKLPAYMLPASFIWLNALPMSANGKIDRNKLPAPQKREAVTLEQSVNSAAAQTLLEMAVRVMEIPVAGLETDFLMLGANSISVIRLINEVERVFGFRPDINTLFRQPRLRVIMDLLEARAAAPPASFDPAPARGYTQPPLEQIRDPLERQSFKEQQHGIRRDSVREAVPLPGADLRALAKQFARRQSIRQFAQDALPLRNLSDLLLNLRRLELGGQPKYFYGSAGGLYPVQVYLFVKPGRVAGLAGGTYYYNPLQHTLEVLSSAPELPADIFNVHVAQPIFQQAAFSIFLVAQMQAILPMYGERSAHFAAIEAGLISQLLEMQATEYQLGLCQIGNVQFEPVRGLFDLDDGHELVHTLLGGMLDPFTLAGMRLGRPWESLVAVQPAGTRPPVFAIHPAGGHILKYYELASHLGQDQPLYGLKARGMEDGLEPRNSIEEMAQAYLEEIRAVQPEGPDTLLGYSVGGYLAYEMAQQLVREGGPPPLLILIDTNATNLPGLQQSLQGWRYLRYRLHKFAGKVAQGLWAVRGEPWRRKVALLCKAQRHRIFVHDEVGQLYDEMLARENLDPVFKKVRESQRFAKNTYAIQPYPGQLVLISAVETGKFIYYGWDELVRGRITVESVPGHHLNVLEGENLRWVAAAILKHLPPASDPSPVPPQAGGGWLIS